MRTGAGPCPHCGYDPDWDASRYPSALHHGSILAGRYIVGRVLGQGGFGITYVALDRPAGQKCAIKEYLPVSLAHRMPGTSLVSANAEGDGPFRYGLECFLEEARVLSQFNGNSNIAAVRSFFQENGTAYFVMEYVEGISFKTYLRNHGGRVSWQEAVRILRPVMEALRTVHRAGIVHRDVAPDNIYIAGSGEIKLLDFGSARYSLGDRSRSLDVVLRPGYAPAEQYRSRSRQGPFTDVYSLAACFYAALTGYLPQESLERVEQDRLIPISRYGIQIPNDLEQAIYRGMAVQRGDRFPSMEEFLAAVDRAVAAAAPPPKLPGTPKEPVVIVPPDSRTPEGPDTPQKPPVVSPPVRQGLSGSAAACMVLGILAGLIGVALLIMESAWCLAAFAAALSLGAAAAILARQSGPQREKRYRDACAAYSAEDYSQAVRLFCQAAGAGDPRAKYCLGECFRWGNGVPQDSEAAFKWYLAAAESGNEDAYYTVACCYHTGDGVAASLEKAVAWLKLAAASHSGAASAARQMLEALQPGGDVS